MQTLTGRGVRVEFVKEGLAFTGDDSPMAHLMLSVMGAFAEFERALIRERQREGIALARKRGVYRGASGRCPPARWPSSAGASPPASRRLRWPASWASVGRPSISIWSGLARALRSWLDSLSVSSSQRASWLSVSECSESIGRPTSNA